MAEIDEEFVHRLTTAFENAPGLPPKTHGRTAWLMRQVGREAGEQPTFESVRRWFNGRSKPAGRNLEALCRVLNVDPGWLAFGAAPVGTRSEQVQGSDRASGAVYFFLGSMLLEGVAASLPSDGDQLAIDACIDVEAILNRRTRRFTVSQAERETGGMLLARPRLPSQTNDHMIVVPGTAGRHAMFHMTPSQVSQFMELSGGFGLIRMETPQGGSGGVDVLPPEGADPELKKLRLKPLEGMTQIGAL